MARKILIIFALIIAIFPYLGFSETVDNSITTVLSLFIAITLLFSRRPRMIKNSQPEDLPKNMPSPFIPKMHIEPTHKKENENQNVENPAFSSLIVKHVDSEITTAIPSPLPIIPKRKIQHENSFPEKNIENIEHPLDTVDSIPRIRKSRKNSQRVLLSQEEQVIPADIPTQAQRD